MPVDDEAAQIARGLTQAQREALLSAIELTTGMACNILSEWTYSALLRMRLVDPFGRLTPLGLRVRAALEAMEKNDGE